MERERVWWDGQAVYNLEQFTIHSMTLIGRAFRSYADEAASAEEFAAGIVRHLRENFRDPITGNWQIALARVFQTFDYSELDAELQALARERVGGGDPVRDSLKCLTLVATAGTETAWNSCASSRDHRLIPLTNTEELVRMPMLVELLRTFGVRGVEIAEPALGAGIPRSFDVFHIEDAASSPHFAAQPEFVQRYGIRSALAFGSLLPSGNVAAVVLFSTVRVAPETAELFKPLSLVVRQGMLPFDAGTEEAGGAADDRRQGSGDRPRRYSNVYSDTLEDLNEVYANAVLGQTQELERTVELLRKREEELDKSHRELEQLHHSQRLESVGLLAEGIAHEINTPMQFIGDNLRFLKTSFDSIIQLVDCYRDLRSHCAAEGLGGEFLSRLEALEQETDFEYVLEEIPVALRESLEGADRVAKIVRAMKEFAHPQEDERVAIDINHAIESAITVARNEWKYVATVETDFDPSLEAVSCYPGELNQVILNLLVNASHAIADAVGAGGEPGAQGKISIRTRRDGDCAEIRIGDTGTGIPEGIRHKIFEQFFTTKAVGKGTGQGLGIVYGAVVKKHGGTVTFETEVGRGTTFIVRIPMKLEVEQEATHA